MRTLSIIIPAIVLTACASQPQGSYVGTAATSQNEGTVMYKDKPGQQLPQRGGGAFRAIR